MSPSRCARTRTSCARVIACGSWRSEAGLRLVDQTKFVTAVSELARNTVIHGGGGQLRAGLLQDGGRQGVYATFEDEGPGIAGHRRWR